MQLRDPLFGLNCLVLRGRLLDYLFDAICAKCGLLLHRGELLDVHQLFIVSRFLSLTLLLLALSSTLPWLMLSLLLE